MSDNLKIDTSSNPQKEPDDWVSGAQARSIHSRQRNTGGRSSNCRR
jgi:hypothetical protein